MASAAGLLLLYVCTKFFQLWCYRMSTDSVFNIAPESLTLGAVLSRGAPGITLYKADLLLGQHTLQVQLLDMLSAPPSLPSNPSNRLLKVMHGLYTGSSKEAVYKWCLTSSCIGLCEGDPGLAACFRHMWTRSSLAGLLQAGRGPLHCHDPVPQVSSQTAGRQCRSA